MKWFFIPGNTPSLKNSKKIITFKPRDKPVRYGLTSSDANKKYNKLTESVYKSLAEEFRVQSIGMDKPLKICFFFVRDSRRKFDYTNAMDTIQDLMVTHGCLPDDNCTEIIPIPCGYHVNKNTAGAHIAIMTGKVSFPKPDKI